MGILRLIIQILAIVSGCLAALMSISIFWIGIALFFLEIIVLLVFKNNCPLTIIARRFSNSTKDNFDIYLPDWLAKNNKVIYAGFCSPSFAV